MYTCVMFEYSNIISLRVVIDRNNDHVEPVLDPAMIRNSTKTPMHLVHVYGTCFVPGNEKNCQNWGNNSWIEVNMVSKLGTVCVTG